MTIIIADISMSLDNVLGVAGAAKQHLCFIGFWFNFINIAHGNGC